MKSIKNTITQGLLLGITFFLTVGSMYIAYGYVSGLGGKIGGNSLTSSDWNSLVANIDEIKGGATVPTGAVMSFNLVNCPTGWTEYTPARGRFIRGIDSTGTNDSVRVAGNIQTDAFQGHWHNMKFGNGSETTGLIFNGGAAGRNNSIAASAGTATSNNIQVNNPGSDGVNGTPRTATETRPKNVALLFCQKN